MTDNGACYRSHFTAALGDAKHLWTRPYRPQTNGKVERFNRTSRPSGLRQDLPQRRSPFGDLPRLDPRIQSPQTPHRNRRTRPLSPCS